MSIIPIESSERSGVPVTVVLADNDSAQVEQVISQVKRWIATETLAPRSIAVLMLSQTMRQLGQRLAKRLAEENVDAHWVGDPSDKRAEDDVGSTSSPVVLSTIHSSKGLEFPKMIVTGIRSGSPDDAERRVAARKTLYVGFTRAVDKLAVIATRDSLFANSLGDRIHKDPRAMLGT